MNLVAVIASDQLYANDIQNSIHTVMAKHRKNVGFESQMAIMGVAIGAILHQLPKHDREYFTKVLIRNVKEANHLSRIMTLN
jgi:hypothetical protein